MVKKKTRRTAPGRISLSHPTLQGLGTVEGTTNEKQNKLRILAQYQRLFFFFFSIPFDFAVRDWARRSDKVRAVLHASEEARIAAIKAMFERHGYEEMEALTRARILYYMQNGYNDADLREPLEQRMKMVPHYLFGFTGKRATQEEIDDFAAYCEAVQSGENP